MTRYSLHGTEAFEKEVDRQLDLVVSRVLSLPDSSSLNSIVLMGGYGRGEGTPFCVDGVQKPFNDYDLIVVADKLSSLRRRQLQGRLNGLAHSLGKDLSIPVDLHLHTRHSLQQAEYSLMNAEMSDGNRVLWGNPQVMEWMPLMPLKQIPLEEGTRLLLNRGALLLDQLHQFRYLSDHNDGVFQEYKFIQKAHLAMGDALLMAFRKYSLSYLDKQNAIQKLGRPLVPHFDWIAKSYQRAIQFKLEGDPGLYTDDDSERLFARTIDVYRRFFHWYEHRRLNTGRKPSTGVYEKQLQRSSQSYRRWFRALCYNLRYLKHRAFRPKISWVLIEPRCRLYVSLPVLLSHSSLRPFEKRLLCSALGAGKKDDLVKRFFHLWSLFA